MATTAKALPFGKWAFDGFDTHAGLEVAHQLGRKGGRKRRMNDSKIESTRKLLVSGVAKNLERFRPDWQI